MITPLVQPELLSHGTIECSDIAKTRRFLTEFLGIDVVRPLPEAQYMWKGGPWSVVCVCIEESEAKTQTQQNRFKLTVESAAAVRTAHAAAVAHKDDYEMRRVEAVETANGFTSFMLLDLNNVWWEITTQAQPDYAALFERGDYAA